LGHNAFIAKAVFGSLFVSSLKDALLKAGLKASKVQNERPARSTVQHVQQRNVPPKKMHAHQQARTYCDVCDRTLPDVEHYRHRNPTVSVNWICIGCADKNEIPDSTRTSAQSEMALKGMFRRYYGATNTSIRPEGHSSSSSNNNNNNNNR
jgi:RNase P subunit RPR2